MFTTEGNFFLSIDDVIKRVNAISMLQSTSLIYLKQSAKFSYISNALLIWTQKACELLSHLEQEDFDNKNFKNECHYI